MALAPGATPAGFTTNGWLSAINMLNAVGATPAEQTLFSTAAPAAVAGAANTTVRVPFARVDDMGRGHSVDVRTDANGHITQVIHNA